MKALWNAVLREMNLIIRDKNIFMIILAAPLFYAFFYATIYINKTERDVPAVVVDLDRSTASMKFISDLDAHQNILIKETVPDFATAEEMLLREAAQAIFIIPAEFENNIKRGTAVSLKIFLNTTRFLVSNDINKAVNAVVFQHTAELRSNLFKMKGMTEGEAKTLIEPVIENVYFLYNSTETYGDFLIPAIILLILQQTLLLGISESVAKERELGTLHEGYTAAGSSIILFGLGKGLFFFVLYVTYSLFFFGVHFSMFSVPFGGNIMLIVLLTICFIGAVTAMSIFIASFFKRKILALQIIAFTSYPLFFLSGYSWPGASLPDVLRILGEVIPLTPFIRAFTRITAMNAGWNEVHAEFGQLLIIFSAASLAALYRLRVIVRGEKKTAGS